MKTRICVSDSFLFIVDENNKIHHYGVEVDSGSYGDNIEESDGKELSFNSNVTAIACNYSGVLIIDENNDLWCKGKNEKGILGLPKPNYKEFVKVEELPPISDIKISSYSLLVDCFGYMWFSGDCGGIFGINEGKEKFTKLETVENISSVSIGGHNLIAVDKKGQYWGSGNTSGLVKNSEEPKFGTKPSQPGIVRIPDLDEFVDYSVAHGMFLFLDKNGNVFASGNSRGLPDRMQDQRNPALQNLHKSFTFLPAMSKVVAANNTMFLLEDTGNIGYHVWEIVDCDYDVDPEELEEYESAREYFMANRRGKGKNCQQFEESRTFKRIENLPPILEIHSCNFYSLFVDIEGFVWKNLNVANFEDGALTKPDDGFTENDIYYYKLPFGVEQKIKVELTKSKVKSARTLIHVGEKRERIIEQIDEEPQKKKPKTEED